LLQSNLLLEVKKYLGIPCRSSIAIEVAFIIFGAMRRNNLVK
jgi:hypothetical protein